MELVVELGQLALQGVGAVELMAQRLGAVVLEVAEGLDDLVLELGLAADQLSLGGLQGAQEPGEEGFLRAGGKQVRGGFGEGSAGPDLCAVE